MGIDSETKLVGLIGHPVKQSMSPVIQNTALQELNLNMRYFVFPVEADKLGQAVKGMVALGFVGFNVTIPYKEAVIPFLDSIHGEAKEIGAVNTVVISNNRLFGYNTDGIGFIQSLEDRGIEAAGKNVLVIGAGGAAKAVSVALSLQGARNISVAVRNINRGQELADRIACLGVEAKVLELEKLTDPGPALWYTAGSPERIVVPPPDMVINATPVGMAPEGESELIRIDTLPKDCIVLDLVYGPRRSKLLQKASAAGHTVLDGSGMLLHQGAQAFFLFTGQKAPIAAMREALDVALCNKL